MGLKLRASKMYTTIKSYIMTRMLQWAGDCGDCLQTHVMYKSTAFCRSFERLFLGRWSISGSNNVRPQITHTHTLTHTFAHIMQSVFRKLSAQNHITRPLYIMHMWEYKELTFNDRIHFQIYSDFVLLHTLSFLISIAKNLHKQTNFDVKRKVISNIETCHYHHLSKLTIKVIARIFQQINCWNKTLRTFRLKLRHIFTGTYIMCICMCACGFPFSVTL